MLRKTNHNRASLRRTPDTEMSNQGRFSAIPESKQVNQANNYVNSNNVVYRSPATRNDKPCTLIRQDSGDCRKMMSHHYKMSVKRASTDEVTTEIAPGIIIQGQVAEL